jgi:hypothetical protein
MTEPKRQVDFALTFLLTKIKMARTVFMLMLLLLLKKLVGSIKLLSFEMKEILAREQPGEVGCRLRLLLLFLPWRLL